MNNLKKVLFALTAMVVLFTSCSEDDKDDKVILGDKNGILLVTFGSSFPEPQKTFKAIDEQAKAKFPGKEIRWAYTSDEILNKLRQGEGEGDLKGKVIDNDTPEEALRIMIKDGYSKVSIQSLHVIPGEEFDDLVETVEKIKTEFPGFVATIGRPLLDTKEDMEAVANVLAKEFKTQIDAGQQVLYMGHGTHHANNKKYDELEKIMQAKTPKSFVGTVEGTRLIGHILPELDKNITEVTITPLMSIAGDHAHNDMNGKTDSEVLDEQSWKERLEGEKYTVNSVMKGLGDYPEINAIWFKHLDAVLIK